MFGRKKKEPVIMEVKKTNLLIVGSYLILGAYFINTKFTFVKIPEKIVQFENWIIFAGGIFLILGAINYLKPSR